jgi:hypothetical protein
VMDVLIIPKGTSNLFLHHYPMLSPLPPVLMNEPIAVCR